MIDEDAPGAEPANLQARLQLVKVQFAYAARPEVCLCSTCSLQLLLGNDCHLLSFAFLCEALTISLYMGCS